MCSVLWVVLWVADPDRLGAYVVGNFWEKLTAVGKYRPAMRPQEVTQLLPGGVDRGEFDG